MPLTTCPDCGSNVSSRAPSCPNCGAPIAGETIVTPDFHGRGEGIFMKSMNCGCMVALGFVVLIVGLCTVGAAG